MDREDIIRMAREAGLDPDLWNYTDAFERFAALVAAAEREKVAAWMMAQATATPLKTCWSSWSGKFASPSVRRVRRCARIVKERICTA
jgi:hypothetical protein